MVKSLKKTYFLTTSNGTLYNLTPENQKPLKIPGVQLLYGDMLRMIKTFENFPKNINFRKFYNFKSEQIYLSIINFNKKRARACNSEKEVEIDDFGFKKISNRQYLENSKLIKPDFIVSMTEESYKGTIQGRKTTGRNIKKSLKFLEETVLWKKENESGFGILAAYQGGIYEDQRKYHFEEILKFEKDIDGLVVYNLFHDEKRNSVNEVKDKNSFFCFEKRKMTYDILQEKKFDLDIGLCSDGNFMKILETDFFGFNFYEISHPFLISKKGLAYVLSKKTWLKYTENYINNNYEISKENCEDIFKKNLESKKLDLNLKEFAQDLSKIDLNCNCYTCLNFSRAYINHLLIHHEMTGNVLLSIHNCFVLKEFFEVLNMEIYENHKEIFIHTFFMLFKE